ncbi:MAG: HAD family phosphatase [Anaerolineae bacterium]|nr:HAD family phosphatase [Anaerolineae bacterium]
MRGDHTLGEALPAICPLAPLPLYSFTMSVKDHSWAVIWDLDGVLVDSTEGHFAAWQRLFAEEGLQLDRAGFLRTFGQRNDSVLRTALGPGLSAERIQALGERKEAYFRSLVSHLVQPMPGARALLSELYAAGARQAIGSSAPRANVAAILAVLGTSEVFGATVAAEDVSQGKPAPDVFLTAAARLRVPPARCIVVEDAPPGVEAARAAGMRCIAVTTTRPAAELWQADRVVASLTELSAASLRALLV